MRRKDKNINYSIAMNKKHQHNGASGSITGIIAANPIQATANEHGYANPTNQGYGIGALTDTIAANQGAGTGGLTTA